MGTLICFHAHPDDEAMATAGVMAKAASQGHRVVLVIATRGERGEIVPGVLADGEQLGVRRTAETYESARRLGVERVEFLGYLDSGMMGEPTNDDPGCFWRADIEHAARRLATILDEEQPDVLTVYDDHGGYGHPDHIQVHRVGHRAAALAGVAGVFENTMNRDHIRRLMEAAPQALSDADADNRPEIDFDSFGSPEDVITHQADVMAFTNDKRQAMLAHRSQIADDFFALAMPDEVFAASFGTEWYIATGGATSPSSDVAAAPGSLAGDLFESLR